MLPATFLQHVAEGHVLRHDHRLVKQGPQIERPVGRHGILDPPQSFVQQVLGEQNSQDVIRGTLVHWDARVLILYDLLKQHVQIVCEGQAAYPRPRHHDLPHQDAVQVKHAMDHFLLLLAQQPPLANGGYNQLHLFHGVKGAMAAARPLPQGTEHQVR